MSISMMRIVGKIVPRLGAVLKESVGGRTFDLKWLPHDMGITLAATSLTLLVGTLWVPAHATNVAAASKTPYESFPSYYYPSDSLFGVDSGCHSTDIAAATAGLALHTVPNGYCNVSFSHWDGEWPNSSGITSYRQRCTPPANIPSVGGYVHREIRSFDWTYGTVSYINGAPVCEGSGIVTHDNVERQFYYYCADLGATLTNYGIGNEPYCLLNGDALKTPHCQKGDLCSVYDPINVAVRLHYEHEIDYTGAGPMPLVFERHYWNNQWRNNFQRSVSFVNIPNSFSLASVMRSNGQRITFVRQTGTTTFTPDADIASHLSGTFDTNGNPTGWTYTDLDDSTEIYDGSGKLLTVTLRSGLRQTLTYNVDGSLATVVDDFGHQLGFGYDSTGRLSTLTDPAGQTYTYAYDSNGNLQSVTYPDGAVRSYLYNESAYSAANNTSLLTGIVDENSQRFTNLYYDSSGAAIASEHPGSIDRVSVAYNADGTASVTDPLGTTRTYTLVSGNDIKRLGSVSGSGCGGCDLARGYTYDAQGFLTQLTDFRGNVTMYSHVGEPTRLLETQRTEGLNASGGSTASTRTIATQWDATYRLPALVSVYAGASVTGTPLRMTSSTYDSAGNQLTKTVTDTTVTPNVSRTWTYTYDSYGRVLTAKGPRTDVNSTTTYAYYTCTTGSQCGQVQTVTDALGHVTTYSTYSAHGQPLTITDPNGVVTTLTYDARLRLTSRSIAGETTNFDYWTTGLLKKVTLADASFVQYSYDNAHRLTQISDEAGNRIVYTLDAMGNRIAENSYDPNSTLHHTHSRVINALNELYQDVNATGTAAVTTSYGYDPNGNQTAVAAPLARNTADAFDELNRLTQITDPGSGVTHFVYDANDNLTSVTDPINLTTSYAYNGFGDLASQMSPATGSTTNTYDSAGNLATSADARGAVATYNYDALNRVSSVAYSLGGTTDQTVSFTYDAGTNGKGHLTGASDANHSMSWGYDPLGRVTSKSQTLGGVTLSVGYGYTNADLTSVTTPSGQSITYGYNGNHQVTSVTLNGVPVLTGATYEPFGPINGWTWGNGTSSVRTFDADGNMSLVNTGGEANSYAFDNASRIASITNATNTNLSWTYGYDALDRLNAASSIPLQQTFTFDGDGNRLSQGGSYTETFTGTLSYNDAGRLTELQQNGSGQPITFIYNALRQRIHKASAALGNTTFMYDEAGHLLGEYDDAGHLIEEMVWLGDTPVASLRPDGSGGVVPYYVHTDHLNAPRKISRPSDNALVWRWDPDAFGNGVPNQSPSGLSTFVSNLRFLGQYFDAETGLNYNYTRYYDSAVGGYIQSDLAGLDGGASTYAYADGNPISESDATGLDPSGGPYHPPEGTKLKCTDDDSCTMLSGKMWVLMRMINSHQLWDWLNPPPRGGGRHAKEIADLWRAYAKCQSLHKEKCENCPPKQQQGVPSLFWVPGMTPASGMVPGAPSPELSPRLPLEPVLP